MTGRTERRKRLLGPDGGSVNSESKLTLGDRNQGQWLNVGLEKIPGCGGINWS